MNAVLHAPRSDAAGVALASETPVKGRVLARVTRSGAVQRRGRLSHMDQWRACGGPRPTRERRYDREPKRHHLLFCRHRYGNDRRGGGLAGHPAAGTHTPRGQIRGQRRHARPTTARTWRRAAKRCAGWLAGGQGGPGGASCVRRGGQKPINQEKTTVCRELQVLRDGSVRDRLARDNCCYREPICQIRRFRPAPRRLPGLDSAIVGPVAPIFNPMIP